MLASPPSKAALVYEPAGCLFVSPLFAIEGNDCARAPRTGDPISDAQAGAPEGEYIDPVTNVVYRLEGEALQPVGVSLSPLGYVSLSAYRYGQFSGDPQADFDCHLGGEFCSPCPAVSFCVAWHVALAGYHEVSIEMIWLNAATPTCSPASVYEHARWDYEGGTPVTKDGRVYPMMPPMSGCGTGDFTVNLYIDDDLHVTDKIRYGPTDCAGGVEALMVDTWVYVDDCAPCEELRHGDTSDLCKVRAGELTEELGQ